MNRNQKHDSDRKANLLFGMAAMVVLAVTMLFFAIHSSKKAFDQDTLCESGKQLDAHTVVLVDKTDPLTKSQQTALVALFGQIKNKLIEGEMLSIFVIDGDEMEFPMPVFSKCAPRKTGNIFVDTPSFLERQFNKSFGAPLNQITSRLIVGVTAPASPIIEMLEGLSREKEFGPSVSQRRLIIYSDMLQNSPLYTHYRQDVSMEGFLGPLGAKDRLANLAGVAVEVTYLDRPEHRQYQNRNHRVFWQRYFKAANASVEFSAPRIADDVERLTELNQRRRVIDVPSAVKSSHPAQAGQSELPSTQHSMPRTNHVVSRLEPQFASDLKRDPPVRALERPRDNQPQPGKEKTAKPVSPAGNENSVGKHEPMEQGSARALSAEKRSLQAECISEGVPTDFCNTVISNNIARFQNIVASYHLRNGPNYGLAIKWLNKSAELGSLWAQTQLGMIYSLGKGVIPDQAQALKWFRRAAEKEYDSAQFILGKVYWSGLGVPRNQTEAVSWYRKAADQGHTQAQFDLGRAYWSGRGVPQDQTEAVEWYRKAAYQGYDLAQLNLGNAYRQGQGVAQDLAEAVRWYRKAAEQGLAEAQFILGTAYEGGWGAPKDRAEAAKWYQKAAAQGHSKANSKL